MPRYLDPKNDFTFKKIFGEHPNLLKSFLNAILPLPEDCFIESLDYLKSENVPALPFLKSSIVDVRCIDNRARHFIVEMHNLHYYSTEAAKDFVASVLGASRIPHTLSSCAPSTPCPSSASANINADSKAGLEDFEKIQGVDYERLSPVYGLALIDANFTEEASWFHHYRMTNAHDGAKNFDDIQIILIELPKFKPTNIQDKRLTVLWLRFLKEINENTQTVDPSFLEVEEIKEALSLLEEASYNKAELEAYDKVWDAVSSEKTLLSGRYKEGEAKGEVKGEAKGLAKGLAQGKAEGKAEGLAEGEAKGKAEERKSFIISMHRASLPVEQICQISGLTKSQIQQILEID